MCHPLPDGGAVAGDVAAIAQDNGFSTAYPTGCPLRAGTRGRQREAHHRHRDHAPSPFPRGKLYAANDLWMNRIRPCQGVPTAGARQAGRHVADRAPIRNDKSARLTALEVVSALPPTGAGKAIAPVSLLLAAPDESAAREVRIIPSVRTAPGHRYRSVRRPATQRRAPLASIAIAKDWASDLVFAGNSPIGFLAVLRWPCSRRHSGWAAETGFDGPAGERGQWVFAKPMAKLYAATTRWIVRQPRTAPRRPLGKSVQFAPKEIPPVGIPRIERHTPSGRRGMALVAARRKVHHPRPPVRRPRRDRTDMPASCRNFGARRGWRPCGV